MFGNIGVATATRTKLETNSQYYIHIESGNQREKERARYIYVKFECVRKRLPVWNECRNIFILHMIQKFSVCNFQLTIVQFFWVYRNFVKFCFGARERERVGEQVKERQRVAKHARKNENCRRCAYLASMFRMPWQENLFTLTHTDTCSQSRYMCAAHTHTHSHFTAAARIYWLPLIHLNGAIKLIKPKHSRCCSCRAAFFCCCCS